MKNNPYRIADAAIKLMNRKALRIAEKYKRRLNIQGFDELSVIDSVDEMYRDLSADAHKRFFELFYERYMELMREYPKLHPKHHEEDDVYALSEYYAVMILSYPNPTTTYTYESEIFRKRDRAKEAINAVSGKSAKQAEIDKAIRIWARMNGWYAIIISQEVEIQFFKDCGVKKVQRHEMHDERVCAECMEADGEIYPINKIPPTHPSCRRWFTPVTKE